MCEELYERLRRHGLAPRADDIIRLTTPAIRLTCQRTEEASLSPGASKLGGLPDLPPDIPWPTWHDEPMAFIAQICLDEAAPYDLDGDLPHSGWLSFFFATDCEPKGNEDDDNPATWKVLHFGGSSTSLVRQATPATLHPHVRFPACAVAYSRRPTLPDVDSLEIERLGLTSQERNAYLDILLGADLDYLLEMDHRLLGYPHSLDGSPFIAGYLGTRQLRYEDAVSDGLEGYNRLAQAAEAEWRLLLQVYSNEEAAMDWAGGGVLHFCIPKEALAARDFSRVWLDMQSL